MKVLEERYIFPPRAKMVMPPSEIGYLQDLQFMAQLKYNDTHILVKYLPGWDTEKNIEFWDRHGERLRSYQPQDEVLDQLIFVGKALGMESGEWSLLDGGLMDRKHPGLRDVIVLWDILVINGEHLLGTTYKERYSRLVTPFGNETWWYTNNMKPDIHPPVDFGIRATDHILMPRCYYGEWDKLWETVHMVNAPFVKDDGGISPLLEGLVLKLGGGTLESGFRMNNNSSWLVRSRVSTGRHAF